MKSGTALWCALSLLLGSLTCHGLEAATPAPAAPAPSFVADDQFFVNHPDLKDEGEIVNEAANTLAVERYDAATPKEAAEALAAKSRAILAERTPEEWQQKAVSLYPALGEAGSEFNRLFVKHYRELQASGPAFTQEPSWPVLLAKRCDDELRSGASAASQAIAAPRAAAASQPPHPDGKDAVRQTPHRSTSFWQTFLALLLLIILTAVPCLLAFRPEVLTLDPEALGLGKSGAHPPAPAERTSASRNDSSIWRAALKHAAIIYVLVALPASVHSLMANSDLGFLDRLFVSLLVGSLLGVFVALPLYGIDTLWHACQKPAPRSATR
jgi:hypothetical protein